MNSKIKDKGDKIMARGDFEAVIGLEVHAELSTKTKIFCSCSTEFGAEPNTHNLYGTSWSIAKIE